MTKKILLSVALFISSIFVGQAQNAFQQLAIGVEAGTYGPGVTLATSLSPNFKLKAGLNTINSIYKGEFNFEPDGFVSNLPEGNTTSLKASLINPKLSFTNAKLIVDYYPMKNGIFSISAGLYAGNNFVSVDGKIDDYKDLDVVFDLGDITVKPNPDGTFSGKLKFGNVIKPYFGFGLGRTIANSRVGFKFDLGLIYQGDYQFESKNVLSGANHVIKQSSELGGAEWLLKTWPMISFALSYRIF